nr:hypothetical protein [uncultured Tolumonas sp.]
MICIANDGQKIAETNYWESDMARAGLLFLSWNEGAARLLVPKTQEKTLKEMKTGNQVVVTRGFFRGVDALEVMFEDHSASPFSIHIAMTQTDRLIPKSDKQGIFDFTVWMLEGEVAAFPAKYRRVKYLPCLQPMKF